MRRSASLVEVRKKGNTSQVAFTRSVERPPGTSLAQTLRSILSQSNPDSKSLAIALSSADLACGDSWTLPSAISGKAAAKVGNTLGESRCTSETLESLVLEAAFSDGTARAVALDRTQCDEILSATGGIPVILVSAVPAVLSEVFGTVAFTQGGERLEVAGDSWRTYPVDAPDEAGELAWQGQSIPFAHAAAFAAAVCDPHSVPNLLNALPQYRKTIYKRFRDPLLNVAAAIALCCGAAGVHFHRETAREREETAAAKRIESELWGRFLPADEPREGQLLKSMRARLEDHGGGDGASDIPSALAFWGAIAKHMPDPEALGMTLESLDLASDGGRLSARVPAVKNDPLKNATQLENRLNESKKLTTRGDYEVRDGQVQIRLRMDYKP